ncbi:uncharacterized protein LOC110253618 [Exaiptasia diaphana]|uniref:Uncharacterized protein n=1 Tax=Exaiptasia diaphana TaxID=2652724 RepID=A0A913Y848_EXADI|nr:uncharacterized protein LOC110253618 [Exaiptasia diaphana]KXJ28744.1 hypothetical protein AC249_AIPGENE3944 [Exaiptasia diaphana]
MTKVDGKAHLCFFDEGSWFQGRLITAEKKQFGLFGEECEPPVNQYHQCCFDEEPMFYKVTFINFETKEDKTFDHVMKTNGDNCTLTSDTLIFHTDEMLTGHKAEEYIAKFCSQELNGKEGIVCIGEMEIQLQEETSDT